MDIYKEGSKGEGVRQIQRALTRLGYGTAQDGVYGPLTREMVMAFQKACGLKADGIVGPATLARMGLQQLKPGVLIAGSKETGCTMGGIFLKKSKRRIDALVIHCTATREGQDMTVDEIRKEHRRQGWADIGYHYVITRDGRVHTGRDVDIAGAHVGGHNANTIGICYVGGLENRANTPYKDLKAKDTRTEAQKAAMLSLLISLLQLYPKARILGHRDYSPDKNGNGIVEPQEWIKQCPSFDAAREFRLL